MQKFVKLLNGKSHANRQKYFTQFTIMFLFDTVTFECSHFVFLTLLRHYLYSYSNNKRVDPWMYNMELKNT